MAKKKMDKKLQGPAPPKRPGFDDCFSYEITDDCLMCGACTKKCPAGAISPGDGKYAVDPDLCIDCGTCGVICPVGAAVRPSTKRDTIAIEDIDKSKLVFNPGCAVCIYKPDVPGRLLDMIREHFGDAKMDLTCCHHDPHLEEGTTIINNCAGCDRRFRSLYIGVDTITIWEVLDSIEGLELPDHSGLTVSVHDSCGFRHKPQVHEAVRSLLRKMNIEIVEAEHSRTTSICCGDNFYGHVPNDVVEKRIKMRADQFPCEDVVVYCIGCVRSMTSGGKIPHYLPDLVLGREAEPMPDTLDEYHGKIMCYSDEH